MSVKDTIKKYIKNPFFLANICNISNCYSSCYNRDSWTYKMRKRKTKI